MPPSEVSLYVPESKNTITSRVKTADGQGFDALHTKKQAGRPSKLGAEQTNKTGKMIWRSMSAMYGMVRVSQALSQCSV